MRKVLAIWLMVALVITLAVPVLAGGPPPGKGPSGKGPKVKYKVSVEGIVTAVNPGASTFTMQIRTPGHQRQVGSSTAVVWVQSGTHVKVKGRGNNDFFRTAIVNDLRVGDRVHVEMFRLEDGRFLALKLDVKNREIAAPPGFGGPSVLQGAVLQGVVAAKSWNTLTVVGADGVTRIVLVSPATTVSGYRTSFASIQVNDVVAVQGSVNTDGTISAQHIEVVSPGGGPLSPVGPLAGGTQMSGVITAKSSVGQFLFINNTVAVNVSSDTRIFSGAQQRSYADLQVGQTINVWGDPIRIGGITVGINARLIIY